MPFGKVVDQSLIERFQRWSNHGLYHIANPLWSNVLYITFMLGVILFQLFSRFVSFTSSTKIALTKLLMFQV